MKRTLPLLLAAVLLAACSKDEPVLPGEGENNGGGFTEVTIDTSDRQLIITEQASASIMIYDQPSRKLLWEWTASDSAIPASRQKWFRLPDEARTVYNRTCLLVTASGGGAALIRIRDKKVLFYAKPDGNPHSAEVLPDNNIVVASSDGYLTVYECDTVRCYAKDFLSRTELASAHNVVWDRSRGCLWSAGGESMHRYAYADGQLTLVRSTPLPAGCGDAHDLTPVYGTDQLLLSTNSRCFRYDPTTDTAAETQSFQQHAIKSISTGPFGYTTVCTRPTESWWSPEVLNFSSGVQLFFMRDYHIYKARWRVETPFSYPERHEL